jgi:probable rRNA maturation factor
MTVEVEGSYAIDVDVPAIEAFADAILEVEGVDPEARLTITFLSTDAIAELNERFMDSRGPTDVLSFPIEDASPGEPPVALEGGPALDLGDIFICPEVVAVHADEYGVTMADELYLMVCHGVLHILGWDHQTDGEAHAMESREAVHLATIGRHRR